MRIPSRGPIPIRLPIGLAASFFILSAIAADTSAPKVPGKREMPMAAACPLELRLIVTEGPGLRAELFNAGSRSLTYLHDNFHQPCGLILKSASGKIQHPQDSRRIGKRNTELSPELYANLAPGMADTLREEDFIPSEGGYELIWGPFRYRGLKPGKYRATATWKSDLDHSLDPGSGKSGRVAGVWKGSLKSNEVELDLKPARE